MTADYFDQWYADIARSEARQRLFTEALGLPPEIGPSNTVPLDGLREISGAVRLAAGGLLVDLACGRGGPGLWIARETSAELVGIDFSAEAVAQASERRALFGAQATARFCVGALEATGLRDAEADAVICIDAVQFATDPVVAAGEIRRILRPGGRAVLTSWEAAEPGDQHLGVRIRDLDVSGALTAAGFTDIARQERPVWHEASRRMWEATMAVDPGDDPALASMRSEGERSLANHDRMLRVLVTAVAP